MHCSLDEHAVPESTYAHINPYMYLYLHCFLDEHAVTYTCIICRHELLTILNMEDLTDVNKKHRIRALWSLSGTQTQIFLCSKVTVGFRNSNREISIFFTGQTTDRHNQLFSPCYAYTHGVTTIPRLNEPRILQFRHEVTGFMTTVDCQIC